MSGVVVVASHLKGAKHFRSKKFRVVSLPCVDDLDYWGGLAALWEGDLTIVNVEHDMECSDELIQQLLDCPHPLCTHAYMLRSPVYHYCHRNGPQPPAGGYEDWWIKEGEEWATYGGIGFCKITSQARVRPLEPREWPTLDIVLTRAVEGPEVVPPTVQHGRRWHVHWPAVHHEHPSES